MAEKRLFTSSASEARIEAATEFLVRREAAEEMVVLGPSRGAVDDLVRRVAVGERRATFGIHRKTLAGFMSELGAPLLADRSRTVAPRLGLEAVARTSADAALKQRQLAYFAGGSDRSPVVEAPSFARVLLTTLLDLRRRGVTPERLRGRTPAEGDLAELLARYEAELVLRGLADASDVARAALEALSDAPGASRPLVLLDVSLEVTDEIAFACALIEASSRVCAVVPVHDTVTLAALAPLALDRDVDERPETTSLDRLRARLFADDAGAPSPVDASVETFSAPSESHEMIEIARRILAKARAGVPFDAMAVALPSRQVYAAHLDAALARAGVPRFASFSTRRPHPAGRALAALLACKLERYSARRFAEYLSLGQVPDATTKTEPLLPFFVPHDESLGRFGAGREPEDDDEPSLETGTSLTGEVDEVQRFGGFRVPRRWERLLGEASTLIAGAREAGAHYYARRLGGLSLELGRMRAMVSRDDPGSPRLAALDLDIADLEALVIFATPVFEALDAMPELAPWEEWIDRLLALAQIALRSAAPVSSLLAELRALSGTPPVALDEVYRVLEGRLLELEQPAPKHRFGRVLIASPRELRGRSFSVVFVPGLTERTFPARVREDPLLSDDLRRGLDAGLPTNDERSHDERLALLLSVGAARDAIVLSYPRVEAELGRPRVPSFYALDVARALHGQLPDVSEMQRQDIDRETSRLEWPAPRDPARSIDLIEHDLAVLRGLLDAPRTIRTEGRARYLLDDSAHLRRSLRARYSRFDTSSITPNDGLVRVGPFTLKALASHSLTARPFSVTSLEAFAICPYRFFLSAIARVAPRDELSRSESLAPATRGDLFHRLAAEITLALRDRGQLPLSDASLPAAIEDLRMRFAAAREALRDELQPAVDRIFDEDCAEVLADLEHLLVSDLSLEGGFVPVFADWGFGIGHRREGDPQSPIDPALLPSKQLLRGAIDAVERETATGVMRITDYKTGLARDRGPLVIGGGEVLQPVLYALTIRALERSSSPTEPSLARLFYATKRGGYESRTVRVDADAVGRALHVLSTIDEATRAGFLVARPRAEACATCAYVAICGPEDRSRPDRKHASTPAEKRHLDALETIRRQP